MPAPGALSRFGTLGTSMLMRSLRVARLGLVGLATALLFSPRAGAFCRQTSCDPDVSSACRIDLVTGCAASGVQLKRPNGCLSFGVARGAAASLGLSDQQFEGLVQEAFDAWSKVDCQPGKPALAVRSVGAVAATTPFACDVGELNQDVWFLSRDLPSSETAGLTTPTFETSTGEVLDADVRLNQILFEAKRSDPELLGLIATVVRHEAGHVLGLAHSPMNNALMYRSYPLTPNRALSADDIAGVCALYPPNTSFTCSEPSTSDAALNPAACTAAKMAAPDSGSEAGGCSLGVAPNAGQRSVCSLLPLLLGALLFVRSRRAINVRG